MVKRDGVETWKDLLEPMINWMNSKKPNSVVSGLDTFCIILSECDDRVHLILPKLIPALFEMFPRADVENLSKLDKR